MKRQVCRKRERETSLIRVYLPRVFLSVCRRAYTGRGAKLGSSACFQGAKLDTGSYSCKSPRLSQTIGPVIRACATTGIFSKRTHELSTGIGSFLIVLSGLLVVRLDGPELLQEPACCSLQNVDATDGMRLLLELHSWRLLLANICGIHDTYPTPPIPCRIYNGLVLVITLVYFGVVSRHSKCVTCRIALWNHACVPECNHPCL